VKRREEERKRGYMYVGREGKQCSEAASLRRSSGRNDRDDVLLESKDAAGVHTNGSLVLHRGSRQAKIKCRGKELTF
jgi:hypothetical protein